MWVHVFHYVAALGLVLPHLREPKNISECSYFVVNCYTHFCMNAFLWHVCLLMPKLLYLPTKRENASVAMEKG